MDNWTKEYEEEQNEQAYGHGYEDGQNADFWDELEDALGDVINTVNPLETTEHKSYDHGFHDGLRDRTGW